MIQTPGNKMPALILLLLLIAVPLAEIAVFIEVGDAIGLWPTLGAILLTALVGMVLIRAQGLATLRQAQAELDAERVPVDAVFTGVCLLVAGVLLLTPGFLTDTVGFLLLISPLRRALGRWGFALIQRHGRVHVHHAGRGAGPGPGRGRAGRNGPVIDGDFHEVDESSNGAGDSSGAPRGAVSGPGGHNAGGQNAGGQKERRRPGS